MKTGRLAFAIAAGAVLTGCAYLPPPGSPVRRVSPDYVASGGVMDARAYIYGKRTVLEFKNNAPSFLLVKDENGASVEYERLGATHIRLARKLSNFTAWANGRAVTFSLEKQAPAAAAAPTPAPAAAAPAIPPVQVAKLDIPAASPIDPQLSTLIKLAYQQLSDVRTMIDAASRNPNTSGAELHALQARLDEIEARLAKASSAVVHVRFARESAQFNPGTEVANALIAAAKIAEHINIRGRTDSRVAGPADPRIAAGRAMAARKFLIHNGVEPDNISISSQADGDFAAPNRTKNGKAHNRRVEIELVHSRIAYLQGTLTKLAGR